MDTNENLSIRHDQRRFGPTTIVTPTGHTFILRAID